MLKVTNAEFATFPSLTPALLTCNPEYSSGRHQLWSETAEEVKGGGVSRLLRLLRCRLAWYGLRSVEFGSFRLVTKDTLSIDLLQTCGAFLCRVEVDTQSGAIKNPVSQALSRLLTSDWQLNGSPRRISLMVQ